MAWVELASFYLHTLIKLFILIWAHYHNINHTDTSTWLSDIPTLDTYWLTSGHLDTNTSLDSLLQFCCPWSAHLVLKRIIHAHWQLCCSIVWQGGQLLNLYSSMSKSSLTRVSFCAMHVKPCSMKPYCSRNLSWRLVGRRWQLYYRVVIPAYTIAWGTYLSKRRVHGSYKNTEIITICCYTTVLQGQV